MFGDMTCLRKPKSTSSRFRHGGSSSTFASSDALDEGLERPEAGEADRGEF